MREREVVLQVGCHHAESGQNRACRRYQDTADANFSCHPCRDQTGGTAEAHKREFAGVESTAHGSQPYALGD